jgi:hypothetical protein
MMVRRITSWTTIFCLSKPDRLEKKMEHQDRYVPADTNGGWPIAGGVVLLAVVCALAATAIHNKTYKDPTDPTWHAKGQRTAPAGGH